MALPTPEEIKKALQPVVDPEIGISVVDLGLIREIQVSPEGVVTVRMTLTAPFCPEGPAIVQEVEQTVRFLPGVKEAAVELVWNPPWDPRQEASEEVKAMLGIWD
jgi:metal-sulfur cluster biosynthetic enzyme